MRRPAHVPLPGLGGLVRFGRTAAATVPAGGALVGPGRGPLSWATVVDPAAVIVHVWRPGEPRAKERPRAAMGTRKDGSNYVRAYTPPRTRQAESEWGWIFKTARRCGPVDGPVGMRLIVLTSAVGGHEKDWDNLGKLVSDAANGILYVDDVQVNEMTVSVRRGRPARFAGVDALFWRIPTGDRLGGYSNADSDKEGRGEPG